MDAIRACEDIIVTVAADDASTMPFAKSAQQSELGIPIEMVMVAGLAAVATKSSQAQDVMFHRFQRLYWKQRGDPRGSSQGFQLTRSVLPTAEQLRLIESMVAQKCKELSEESDRAMKELLKMEARSAPRGKSKGSRNKSKAKVKPKVKKVDSVASSDGAWKDDESSSPQVSADKASIDQTRCDETRSRNVDHDDGRMPQHESTDRTPQTQTQTGIVENGRGCADASSTSRGGSPHRETLEVDSIHAEGSLQTVQAEDVKPRIGRADHSSRTQQEVSAQIQTKTIERNVGEVAHDDHSTGSDDGTNGRALTTMPSMSALQRQVRELQTQLQRKDTEIDKLKTDHAQQLRVEREAFEERMQALQLRLYISETRLKTFQDALDQHVQSVASNVSSNYRNTMTTQNEDSDTPSPLFARTRRNR
uniref:Uncharacterized protein n=1 Tax=Craspedostauros australis TaxID=1486917 RepID=A0A7R9WR62_9STRA|mmetsp:Transcript_16975/g.46984  ORF Transcript_16975/g.46984 Transcript_16975/m.46984 type:complete len:420 (+) Transcript_16975:153-1412(+)